MKKIIVFCGLFFVGCLLGSSPVFAMMCHSGHSEGEHEKKSEKKNVSAEQSSAKESFYSTSYVCPMHPEVQSEKSGKCPKCNMKLEKKSVLMTYACPEKDCEYQSAKPGKCPKHDKELVKCEMKTHCPKCGEQVNPEELKLKPTK